jgi:hypothetical protein
MLMLLLPTILLNVLTFMLCTIYCHVICIVTCWGYTPLIRQVLVCMIGFISSWVTHSLFLHLHTGNTVLSLIYTHLQITVAHALGFPGSPSRLLATHLDTGIITVLLNHTLQILHIKSSLHRYTLATNSFLHNSRHSVSYWELTETYSRTTCKWASVSPISPWSDMRKNRALLLSCHCGTCRGHMIPPHSCVIQVFIMLPSNERGEAGQGATWHDTAELDSAQRKHRFVYCCVIAGTCFEVSFLAWRKYATLLPP